jgi:hypothetical protein
MPNSGVYQRGVDRAESKRWRQADVTEKNHEAEKPTSFNTKRLAKISP